MEILREEGPFHLLLRVGVGIVDGPYLSATGTDCDLSIRQKINGTALDDRLFRSGNRGDSIEIRLLGIFCVQSREKSEKT